MPRKRLNPVVAQPKAFTLVEVMVTMVLFGILAVTISPAMRRSSVSTKGAALALSSALTEARQQAITQQVPVALVIPSGNGSQGQANSYYIVAGEQPRVTQVKRFGDEQADLRLMVGHWPLDTGQLRTSTLTTTITPPPNALWENNFDLNLWGLPAPKDYAFVFTPRGKVLSNDLPHFDGAYHIVVSAGGRSTAASAPGTGVMTTQPVLYSLTQVGTPYTVAIDPSGCVSVMPGLTAVSATGVEIVEQAASVVPPDPPGLTAPPSAAPVVTSLTLLPDPAKLSPPDGVDMLLAPGRHMTMTVRAKSSDNTPLFCQWKATGGGLSSPEQVRATFLPQSQEWESVWQWRFPADAEPGDRFTLEGVVKDAYGNEAPVGLGTEAAPFVVQTGDPSTRVAFTSSRLSVGVGQDIFLVNGDGTGLTNVSDCPGWERTAKISPDGQRLVCDSERDSGMQSEIYLMNVDGTNPTSLAAHSAEDIAPAWSPQGGHIAFLTTRWGGQYQVATMNADGSGLRRVSFNTQGGSFAWSPDGTRIAFTSRIGSSGGMNEIMIANRDGSAQLRLTNNTQYDGSPAWSPDGTRIAFLGERSGKYGFLVKNADGTGPETMLTDKANGSPLWSPDGTRIGFSSTPDGIYNDPYVMNADGTGQTNLLNAAGHDYFQGWSGDGRHIVCSVSSPNWEIFIMDPDGTNQVNLSNDSRGDFEAHVR